MANKIELSRNRACSRQELKLKSGANFNNTYDCSDDSILVMVEQIVLKLW